MPPDANKKPKARMGLGQELNSSLEADLVVDVVSHLSKVERDCFVLNKPVARTQTNKQKFDLNVP